MDFLAKCMTVCTTSGLWHLFTSYDC